MTMRCTHYQGDGIAVRSSEAMAPQEGGEQRHSPTALVSVVPAFVGLLVDAYVLPSEFSDNGVLVNHILAAVRLGPDLDVEDVRTPARA